MDAAAVASSVPMTVKAVVDGDLIAAAAAGTNQQTITHNAVPWVCNQNPGVDVIGSGNTLAVAAVQMLSGSNQHESCVDYVWLQGGFETGEYTSQWLDAGGTAAWTTATIEAAIAAGQGITARVEVGSDGATAADAYEVALSDGSNEINLTGHLTDSRYIRVTFTFASGGTHGTPTVSAVGFQGEASSGPTRSGFRLLATRTCRVQFCRPARGPMILGDH